MIYVVNIDENTELKVELHETKRGVWTARVADEGEVEMQFLGRDDDGAFVVSIGGRKRRFQLDKNCTTFLLAEGEDVKRVNVADAGQVVMEHDRWQDVDEGAQVDTLATPITGVVLEILVARGDTVEKDDPVVVVEAMKMENTLLAPSAGRVAEIPVALGQTVHQGDTLLRIE